MRKFLEALAETGDVPTPAMSSAPGEERLDVDDLVRAADAAARLEAPCEAPPLDIAAARWAARTLFRACVCLADRTVDAPAVSTTLAERGPAADSAAVCWSVDLFLRHLPELLGLARGLAPSDPLLAAIEDVGASWPLSSIGMRAPGDAAPPASVERDPCLRKMYVDRVIRRGDASRTAVAWVAEGVRAALGAHVELAPAMAAASSAPRGVPDDV